MKKIMPVFAIVGALFLTGCDRAAKNGDTVIIDFAGFLGEQQFDGGTATNFPLKLGSGQFVPGFEDQLVGMKKGEERDIKIKFPEQYVPGLAGQDVVFKVKLVDIKE
jgi:trigger factor